MQLPVIKNKMKTKSGEGELASLRKKSSGRRATKNTNFRAKKLRRKTRIANHSG